MNSEVVLSIFDDLDASFCEHAALSVREEAGSAAGGIRVLGSGKTRSTGSGKTGFFSVKRNRLIAVAAVLIIVAVCVFGPWPPKHAENVSEVQPTKSRTSSSSMSVSRSIAIKDIPGDCIYKELTESEVASVFKDAALEEIAQFIANANMEYTKYEAYFYSDGTLITLKLTWSFNDGEISVSFEPDVSIPKSSMGFVKPGDKPTIVNGWETYLCQLTQNTGVGGSEQVVWPNEYDLFMSKDGLVIHAFCFSGVLDDMLAFCDNLTWAELDLGAIRP